MPNEYPFDEDKIDREGVNPEVLELTMKELAFRSHFDEPNESILKRRSIVGEKMEALGLSPPTEDTKQLSSLRNLPESSRLSFVIRKGTDTNEADNEAKFIEHDVIEDANEDTNKVD